MENEISLVETCTFLKVNGERCGAQKLRGLDFCYFHAPSVIVERAEARRRGGLNRYGDRGETGSYIIRTPQDVLTILEDAINDACALGNTAGRAKTIGYLAQIVLKGFEVTELEGRLKALENKVRGHQK